MTVSGVRWVLISTLITVGCEAPAEVPAEAPSDMAEDDGDFGLDRFVESADARGLTPDVTGFPDPGPNSFPDFGHVWAPGRIIVEDLDDDGDLDVLFSRLEDPPQAFRNVGGSFEEVPVDFGPTPEPEARQPWATFSLVDLTNDTRPDLVFQGGDGLYLAENTGGFVFRPLREIGRLPHPGTRVDSHVWGDPDGDGDLDLWLPTMSPPGDGDGDMQPPTPETLFLNDGGELVAVNDYYRSGSAGLSILATWTDHDNDGDLDLLSFSDRGERLGVIGTAYRNEGVRDRVPVLAEDGPEIGLAVPFSAMGVGKADLNDDGTLDFCISDLGPVVCLLSSPAGWVAASAAIGLEAPARKSEPWVGWSLELVDLDHDGWVDMPVVAAAADSMLEWIGPPEEWSQPDVMYRGGPDGFERVFMGLESPAAHPSMVTADVDGDGSQDILVAGYAAPAQLFMNRPSSGAWLTVKAVGAPGNPRGIGARVEVTGERLRIREIDGQRALGQGPAYAHFGLGDADEVDVMVRWPDGAEVELPGIETRRVLEVEHPDG